MTALASVVALAVAAGLPFASVTAERDPTHGPSGASVAYTERQAARLAARLQPAGRARLARVDLRRFAVVAAFRVVSSGGHDVRVVDVTRSGSRLVVGIRVVTPGPDCLTTQALVTHYHLVRVPRNALRAPRPTSAVVRKRAEVEGPRCG